MDGENTPPRKTAKCLHLPEEIIEEILARLPVKSLLRLRCVSKSWRCLIGSERFIKTHLEKSRKKQSFANWRVVLNYNSRDLIAGFKRCSLSSYKCDPNVDPSPIDDPTNNHLMQGSQVVGHSNGLLCILRKPSCLFLWNPATRISFELPKLDLPIKKYGCGWDEQSGAHKVFAVMSRKNEDEGEEEWIGNVYSSKTNSWKTVEHGSRDLHDLSGEVVCGKIHWPTRGGYIETFDLKSEMFGMIELPFKHGVQHIWLEPHEEKGGCLEVGCDNNRRRMSWEMKKYGVKESWVKLSSGNIPSNYESTHMVWGVDKGVVKFYSRNKIGASSTAHYYVESLVSPLPHKDHL